MRAKSMVLILIAGGCGLVASIGISQVMTQGGDTKEEGVEKVPILVAKIPLSIGDKLDAESVMIDEWPVDRVPEDAISDFDEVKDLVPNMRLYEGEPIVKKKLIDHLANAMPAIPEGFRVVPLRVNEEVAPSLLLPGDRVDILVFLRKNSDIHDTEVKTVLRDVRVFAVNSRTERVIEDDQKIVNAKTVSVLVKPNQVEMLAMATELGKIRLSLRRHNDTLDEESDGYKLRDFLAKTSERADDDKPAVKETPDPQPNTGQANANTFSDFLKNQNNTQPASQVVASNPDAAPFHDMLVITPDGMTSFTWNKEGQLPVATVLGSDGSQAPAPPMPVPATGSAPPSQGAGDVPPPAGTTTPPGDGEPETTTEGAEPTSEEEEPLEE